MPPTFKLALQYFRIDDGVVNASFDLTERTIGTGDNQLMGVGATKTDIIFTNGRGLASLPATATNTGAGRLIASFTLSSQIGENIFNVSVDGISGIITVPGGSYVGSTLASALEERISQIEDPVTGKVIGGVTVDYNSGPIISSLPPARAAIIRPLR